MPKSPPPRKSNQRRNAQSAEKANHLIARGELIEAIAQAIAERGWTQTEAARVLGVAQPRISDLINGRTEKFTVDMLMIWLEKLGKDVSLSVKSNGFKKLLQPVQLTLYVSNDQHHSICQSISSVFDGDKSKFSLTIVDVLNEPVRAEKDNITATPCLVRETPAPRLVLVGNLTPAHVRWCLPTS